MLLPFPTQGYALQNLSMINVSNYFQLHILGQSKICFCYIKY